MYQLQTRLTDVLNYPMQDRIRQLMICIETAPIKDLQAFLPTLVHHIFGFQENVGWGLRTVTDKNFHDFKLLYDFFNPHGPFFHLLYRLLIDTNKYEIKMNELPIKVRKMLESGRYSSFYANLMVVDNFQPRNLSLSLNPFDFYIFHFCIHGMKNLHKMSQAALNVNNENSKTVFFNLAADYLCNFLPSDPNASVFPHIDCSPVKSHSTMPLPTMSPTKPPKYLLLSSLSHQIQNPTANARDLRLTEVVRSSTWRSESVMMIFIDCWLRYDIDESWELPGNEFIRLVRILVKQLHFFGNVAEQDLSMLSVLRQQAQSLLNIRLYPLLKTIISRWPLDTSFLNVLELWLSYIQPWRYIYNRNIQNLNSEMAEIPERFKVFINENLFSYTQIFVRLIPRFLKMDLSSNKNAFMLFRMMKVFRQLSDILREYEKSMMNNNSTIIRTHSSFNESSIRSSPVRTQTSFNRSGDRSPYPLHRSLNQSAVDDSSYVYMFSDEITMQIYELLQRLYISKLKTERDVQKMEKELQKHTTLWDKFLQFIGWLSSLSLSFSWALEEKKKTPVYLDFCLNILSPVYNIRIEDVTRDIEHNESLQEDSDDDHLSMDSEFLNITPSFMKQRLHNITYTGDPLLLPIMGHEVKFLVRFLHQVSSKLNEMFENEFQSLWNRNDMTGKLARQILCPPVETRTFDKSAGYPDMKVEQIGPRISLRKLASRNVIMLIVTILILGRFLLGASSLGFITFAIIAFVYLIIKAAFST